MTTEVKHETETKKGRERNNVDSLYMHRVVCIVLECLFRFKLSVEHCSRSKSATRLNGGSEGKESGKDEDSL